MVTSLAVQWLRLHTFKAVGSIPGQGTKIQHAMRRGQKQTKKQKSVLFISFLPGVGDGCRGVRAVPTADFCLAALKTALVLAHLKI